MRCRHAIFVALLLATTARAAHAQAGGFVVTLGRDTVQAEQFTRRGGVFEGIVVTRVPTTRVARYQMEVDTAGRLVSYDVATSDAAGVPLTFNGARGSLSAKGDSMVRITLQDSVLARQVIAAPAGFFPSPTVPYIGVTYLVYEQALQGARNHAGGSDSLIRLMTMSPFQKAPQATHAWFPTPDSAEIDYFRVARSGYRFDSHGQLLRADWTNTTYRYVVNRVGTIDVMSLANAWDAAERRGAGLGALSPRDTVRATVGGSELLMDYSRPAARGRAIWGEVVKPGVVWRLGADMATHFTTSRDIRVGDYPLPAGRYTLWMITGDAGDASLVISSRVDVFGTQYQPRADLVRVPLARHLLASPLERLTIAMSDAAGLTISWGDVSWSIPLRPTP